MKQIKSLLASLTICMVLVGGIPSPDPGAYAAPASAETAGSPEEGIPEPVTGASIAETEPQEDTPPPDTGAGTAPGIQPPEATDAALDAGAASGGAEQDGSPTGGAIAPEPVSAAAVSGGGVSVLAAEERFIDLPCYTGEQEVADLDASAPWSSSDETVARLEGGKIVVGAMGTAIVTVGLEGGGTADCHVNSYWVYPQPKTSTVRPAAGVELRQWAREDGKGMTGDHVQQDARLTLLWRVDVNDRRNQYARSQSGKEGYLVDLQNVHRSAASYYKDVAVGDITFFSTFTGSIPDSYVYNEDNNWSVADAGTLGLATQSLEGFANQARVTGLAEGVSSVRATLQDDHYVASTMLCTVYTPVDSVEVTLGGRAYVYEAAADDGQVRVAQVLGAGDTATVSGECGDYWRIGESRYIKKGAAFIAPESIAIVPDEVHLETKGDLKWYQLEVEVFPSGAQFDPADVNWSIDGEDIASIDGGGIVSGIHAGEATVTAEYHGLTATCQVYVGNVAVAGLWIDPEEMFLKPGQFRRARASTAPPTAYNRSLQWSSDNPAVASVHEGTVTAHKPGKAVVTVTTSDGSNLSARCQVTVAYEIPEQVPLEPGERIGTEPDLRLTAFTGNSYTVAFDAITYKRHSGILTFNPKAEHYMLYRRLYTQGSGDYSLLKSFDMKLQTAASHKDTGIRMDEAYVYMLVVYDKKGGTVVRKETLTTGQKQQVQGLTVQAQTDREVRLSWTAQSGVGGYLVYRAVGGSEFTLIRKLVGAGTAYFTDTGLKPKTTYSYRVCSYVKERWESNGAYWKTLLNKRAGGSDTTSRLRLNLKLAKFSPSTARVGFDVVAGAKHYLLQERKGSGYTDVKVKTTSEPAGGRDWLEAPDTGSGERVFRVCAYDKKGGSKVTHEYITLRSTAVPGTTIRSVAKGRDDVTVALQWGRVNRHGITGYKVYRSTDGKE
ncbi:MAG: Ig-like domain-containing protein [Clostridiales Family XIII bacterium]|jgi:hypothetical protein|nr:Ig-like domain-containing protein [Clostridiales Family XIII bacterium]